jgi:rhodanese-related sulfurtransferase
MNFLFALSLLVALSITAFAADKESSKPDKPSATAPKTKVKKVGVEEFDKLRADKKNVVLDVRTEEEYKAGHIPGSVNIDFNSPDFEKKVADLDKNKTYLVHCAAGGRSARACKKLEGAGFKELYDLAPGFNGWSAAGKPSVK